MRQSIHPSRHLCLLALCIGVSGCETDTAIPIADWTLHTLESDTPVSLHLPTHIDRYLPSDPTRYRLTANVAVPPEWRGQDLWLLIPTFDAPTSLFINGHQQSPTGEDTTRRHRGDYRWHIPAAYTQGPVLAAELRVTYAFFGSAWLEAVPLLVATEAPPTSVRIIDWFNGKLAILALVLAIQIGFTYLAMWKANPHYRWLGIELIFASLVPLDLVGVTTQLVGSWDVPILASSLTLGTLCSVYFLHAQFALPPPSAWWRYTAYAVVAVCITFVSPLSRISAWTAMTYVLVTFVYNIETCRRLSRRPNAPPTVFIVGSCWVLLSVLSTPDFSWWMGGGDILGGVRPGSLGVGIFALVQSSIWLYAHLHAIQRSVELNKELQASNGELQRQIGNRSRQLYNALALNRETTPRTLQLNPGQLVQNRYRVVKQIGVGGMGYVYEVLRLEDDKRMALKIANGIDGTALARLAREAELASQVNHPNVVSLFDLDVADSGFVYMVMELVNGVSLEACKRQLTGETDSCLSITEQLARGLAALHTAGIVHRDLKPANTLLNYPWKPGELPQVKIVDFGISRSLSLQNVLTSPGLLMTTSMADGADMEDALADNATRFFNPNSTPLTQGGTVPGTPPYMAPELADGNGTLSPASDIYSLGLIGYELLAGAYPFKEPPVFTRLRGKPPVSPTPLSPMLTATGDILMRCLSLNPAQRPNLNEIVEALHQTRTHWQQPHAAGMRLPFVNP